MKKKKIIKFPQKIQLDMMSIATLISGGTVIQPGVGSITIERSEILDKNIDEVLEDLKNCVDFG